MKIIKLSAIASTNTFLKELAQNSKLENFTTVVTENQYRGRGQVDTVWMSEPYKNLTFSTLINNIDLSISDTRYINFATTLAICKVLESLGVRNINIKWPNDIMSAAHKICGILIENTFVGRNLKNSIVGIGLNVNQTNFSDLQNVTSLKCETGNESNIDDILIVILESLKERFEQINNKNLAHLEKEYLKKLYKIHEISSFKTAEDEVFCGKIIGVSNSGSLQILLENNTIKEFGIKEVKFL